MLEPWEKMIFILSQLPAGPSIHWLLTTSSIFITKNQEGTTENVDLRVWKLLLYLPFFPEKLMTEHWDFSQNSLTWLCIHDCVL